MDIHIFFLAQRFLLVLTLFSVSGCITSPAKSPIETENKKTTLGLEIGAGYSAGALTPPVIHFLSVGNGMCHAVECSNDEVMIVDCGGSVKDNKKDPNQMTNAQAVTYLNGLLINKNAYVVISHPHVDHYSTIPMLFGSENVKKLGSNFSMRAVYYGGKLSQYDGKFQSWYKTLNESEVTLPGNLGADYKSGAEGERPLSCGKLTSAILIANASYDGKNANDNSIVLAVRKAQNNSIAFFPGDATKVTTDKIIYPSYFGSGVTIASMAHHGSDTYGSNQQNFVNSIKPKTVVASAGTNLHHKHPRCDILYRYRDEDNLQRPITRPSMHNARCFQPIMENGVATKKFESYEFATNQDMFNTFSSGTLVMPLEEGKTYKPVIQFKGASGNIINILEGTK